MNLSQHFTLEEACFSPTATRLGINNTPSAEVIETMKSAADQLEAVRNLMRGPLHVDSWYRCQALNSAVNGSVTSDHLNGSSIDFICPSFGSPIDIVMAIAKSGIKFDQLIQEGAWVHISFATTMRQEVMTAHFTAGKKTTYSMGV